MSIFTVDHRGHKQQLALAIEQFKKDDDLRKAMSEVEVFCAAIGLKPHIAKHFQMLLMAGSLAKALTLVSICKDFELRRWIRWPLLLVIFPFRLIYNLLMLGLGGRDEHR